MRYPDITPLFIFQLGLMLFKRGDIGIELQVIARAQRLIGQKQHPAIAQGQLDPRAPILGIHIGLTLPQIGLNIQIGR